MFRALGVVIAVAGLTLVGSPVYAQKSGERLQQELHGDGQAPDEAAKETHAEGEYGGVVPGKVSEKRRAPRKGKRAVLTWIGFQARGEAGSQFFVQLTRDAEVQQDVVGNKLVVTIAGARFASRNARRRLDTRFFPTAVLDVTPRSVGRKRARKGKPGHPAGIQLTFEFKNPSDVGTASLRSGPEQDGYFYVFLEFGPGTPAPEAR